MPLFLLLFLEDTFLFLVCMPSFFIDKGLLTCTQQNQDEDLEVARQTTKKAKEKEESA